MSCKWKVLLWHLEGQVLMALCFLQQAQGHVQLLPPQNVTLLSKDFDMILTWAPGGDSPPDVVYTVRYASQERRSQWKKVPHCKNIVRTSCNLTCVYPDVYVKIQARVKAVLGRLQSPWVESQSKDYHSAVELAPPVLNVNVKEDLMHINASFPLPLCVESLLWGYDLNIWKAGSDDKKKYEGNFRKETLTLNTTALRGIYCLSARSFYESINMKYSEFSQPVCVPLNHRAVEWKVAILVVVLPIFLTSPFIICLLKQDAKQRKMPQALDFSHLKAAGPAFYLEPSEKEFCSDDLSCTEKLMPQRKTNKALARNNLPWMASFLSSSSSLSSLSSLDDDEEEDSSTFIPYNKVTRLPKRHLNYQPSQSAQGETSLDSGTGGLSVASESVLDLSTLGFSFFPKAENEVDTSGSQANEETSLSHSSSLGRISLTDVRFPGASEHKQHEAEVDECLEMTPLQPLTERLCAKHPPDEHYLHRKSQHLTKYYQKSIADLQVQISAASQPREVPNIQLLIPFHTLQVAEDEGIASDCDSDTCTEGTPPTPTVLSDTFETSHVEEKHDQKFQFRGYQHRHYMART